MVNAANISMVSAEISVNGGPGSPIGFVGSGTANVDEWTLADIDLASFAATDSIEIIFDFDEAHFGSGGNNDPFFIVDQSNLPAGFSLSVDSVTGVFTLSFVRENVTAGSFDIDVGGHGDSGVLGDDVFFNFTCFAKGTMIETPTGPKAIERLAVGDKVLTKSDGVKPIRWVGSKALNKKELAQNPHLKPVCIKAGALGKGLPNADLFVSPQHRVCFDDNKAVQLLFGVNEALAPSKGPIDDHTVVVSDQDEVTYYHIMFDQHEIVSSNGAWTESFYPGPQALDSLEQSARDELYELFPQLQSDGGKAFALAAQALSVQETRLLNKLTPKDTRLLQELILKSRTVH